MPGPNVLSINTRQPQTSHNEMSLLKKQDPSTEEGKILKAVGYIPTWTTNNIQKFVETESKNVILTDACFQRPGKNRQWCAKKPQPITKIDKDLFHGLKRKNKEPLTESRSLWLETGDPLHM